MWNLKYGTNELIYKTEKDSQTQKEQTCGCQGGERWGRDRLGVWGQQMQAITYRMDEQQGLTIQHRELYSIPMINHNGKEYKKRMYPYV